MACIASSSAATGRTLLGVNRSHIMATRWLHRYPRPSAVLPTSGLRHRAFHLQSPAFAVAAPTGEKLVTEDVPMVFPTSTPASDKGKGRLQESSPDNAKAAAERGEAVEPKRPRRTLGLKSKKAAISLVRNASHRRGVAR